MGMDKLCELFEAERPMIPDSNSDYYIGYNNGLLMAQAIVLNRDVVEVVRCKDCKHYKQNPWSKEENMMCMCWCDWLATDPDDFCSYGERREGE